MPDYMALLALIDANATKIVVTCLIFLVYVQLERLGKPRIEESVDQGRFQEGSAIRVVRLSRVLFGIVGAVLLMLLWGVDLKSMLIFGSTLITVLGVALFAGWSILSNVTAYFILLVNPAFKRGTFIRIVEADNYAEGYISELYLFNTRLVTENREVILYPNNLLLGRPVMLNPRDRREGMGKLIPALKSVEPSAPREGS